jgi:hypothetical protein
MIKTNNLTEKDPAKLEFPPWRPRAVRPPLPEKLVAGQPPTSRRPILRFTPWIAAKLRGYLGYHLDNLSTKVIAMKRSQSKGIADLGLLGHELEQLEKPANQGRFKGVLGAKSPTKEAQGPHT